jgi:hypothetical protein
LVPARLPLAWEIPGISGYYMRPLIKLITFFILSSCDSRSDTINKVDATPIQKSLVDTAAVAHYDDPNTSFLLVWQVDFDNKLKKKNPNFREDYLNADSLIKGLNTRFPNILLEKIKLSHDTLYTEIRDSHYLCERMGTSGATFYLAEAVINLTSVNNVRFVKIDFEEGSHASPDIWSKEDFSDYEEIK